MEEIDRTHRATLKLALDVANSRYAAWLTKQEDDKQRATKAEADLRAEIQRKAKDVKF